LIFGPELRRALLATALLFASHAALAERDVASGDWSLSDLMARLGETRTGSASFVERHFVALVREPLQSSGVLSYQPPDRLEKRTLLPRPARLLLSGSRVTIERDGASPQTIALSDYPEIGALVEGVRATLSGDLATLERFYAVSLQGNAGDWSLRLVPLSPRTQALVREIRIAGRGGSLARIDTEAADGDRTEMIITQALP
jgi:hypothetical protein